jgi:hypothetical protein
MPKKVIFKAQFMDTMYKNMWQFINPDMITHMFPQVKITYKNRVDDDKFTKSFKDSLCFKGPEDEGHYVYITDKLMSDGKTYDYHGTYEDDLLTREEDDGVCHGVAIIFALHEEKGRFPINIQQGRTKAENKRNYISILKLYQWLIESGLWDKALEDNFYDDVDWINDPNFGIPTTLQTIKAKDALKKYISYLRRV